jgi:hypothetical protein
MRRAAAAVCALAILSVLAGCGGGSGGGASTARAEDPAPALLARLRDKGLHPEWVRCAARGRAGGAPVFRCNVNFGDPRISPYCAQIRDGALVTQLDDPGLRCGRVRPGPGSTTPP